jgi:hypothetical protein
MTAPENGEQPRQLWFWHGSGGGVVTAIATVVAAIIGGIFVGNTGVASPWVPGAPTVTMTVAGPAVTHSQTVTVTPTTTQQTATQSLVRNSGPLTLKAGGTADLDSLEANWGGPDVAMSIADIRVWDAGPNTKLDGGILYTKFVELPVDAPNTYVACSTASGYGLAIPGANVVKGLKFCVFTNEHRYALLTITDTTPARGNNGLDKVTFDVTAWNQVSS